MAEREHQDQIILHITLHFRSFWHPTIAKIKETITIASIFYHYLRRCKSFGPENDNMQCERDNMALVIWAPLHVTGLVTSESIL